MRTTPLHMYHSHAFVAWTFCYKHMCTVLSLSRFLWKAVRVVDIVSVPASLQALKNTKKKQHFSIVSIGGQFEGGERMGLVLSHSHCTIEWYRLLVIPSLHPPLLCLHWQCVCPAWCADTSPIGDWTRATCVPLKRLAIRLPLMVRAVKSNAVILHCVAHPLISGWGWTVWEVVISALAPHLMDTSPWSSFVQVFCLIYGCLRLRSGLLA